MPKDLPIDKPMEVSKSENSKTTQQNSKAQPKKPYVAPKLTHEGKWDTVTLQGSPIGGVFGP